MVLHSLQATRSRGVYCNSQYEGCVDRYVDLEIPGCAMPARKKVAVGPTTKTRRSTRRKKDDGDDIPDVFYEMIAEAEASSVNDVPRPVKRRKLSLESEVARGEVKDPTADRADRSPSMHFVARHPQVVYDDFEDSDEGDIEFEDVDIDVPEEPPEDDVSQHETFTIDLSKPATTPSRNAERRRFVGTAERKIRLEFHKIHVQLLLLALWNRNRWCESQQVHSLLKPIVSRKTISQLHVDESESQFQRSHSFNLAIQEICTTWRTTFDIIMPGMRRAHWRDAAACKKDLESSEDYLNFNEFKTAAQTRRGSRDVGAQLFCALLRSLAVEARLVCSLQVLPFSAVAKGATPEKPKVAYIQAEAQSYESFDDVPRRKRVVDSAHPIWWVEVYSPAASTWIPLDPLVRNTINKPKTGFEPPASDQLNSMSYVIAFEDDGSARDVTRRYTQWFNAKTRKTRVESTKGGEQWWKKAMKLFEKQFPELRDAVEDGDLLRRARAEGMPKNVQDFKSHPIYVLERHLRLNEVIEPRREVGQVAVGTGVKTQKMETVFRRQDVYLCRTADAWYRKGRDVRNGEVPLKRVVSRRQKARSLEEDADAEEMAAVYAEYQTDAYEPAPVENGRVPKNSFGNLDVYVPSMIPGGAIHIQHPMTVKAARLLGIDYAEAVTGFEFKGRQGTAIMNGAVVAAETRVAMVTVLIGLQSQASEEVKAERSHILIRLWKRWLTSLRIRERIERDYGGNEENQMELDRERSIDEEDEDGTYEDAENGGGFVQDEAHDAAEVREAVRAQLPSATAKQVAALLPPEPVCAEIVVVESPHKRSTPTELADDAIVEFGEQEEHEAGGFMVDEDDAQEPDGFMVDDNQNEPGGFVLDEEEETPETPVQPSGKAPPLTTLLAKAPAGIDDNAGGFLPGDTSPVLEANSSAVIDTASIEEPDAIQYGQSPRAPPLTALLSKRSTSIKDTGAGFLPQSPQLSGEISTVAVASDRQDLSPAGLARATEQEVNTASKTQVQEDGAESDVSMLSHDPDEDEAEPEWLVDSLS